MKNLAIFDLDNTLINTDSDHSWPQYLIKKGIVDAAETERKMKSSTKTTKMVVLILMPSSNSILRL